MSILIKNNHKLTLLIPFLLLAGCLARVSEPLPIAKDRLASFSSAQELVNTLSYNSFEIDYDYVVGGYEKLKEPSLHLSQFCEETQNAKFSQIVDFGFSGAGGDSFIAQKVKGSFGRFACISNGERLWEAEIRGKHSRSNEVFSGIYLSKVTVTIRDRAKLDAIAAREKAINEQREQERIAKVESRERAERNRQRNQRLALDNYNNATMLKKSVGDKVCTSDNLFGYVEAASEEKIKVSIVGKVIKLNTRKYMRLNDYFFFNSDMYAKNFTSEKVNVETIWANSSDWAGCSFKVNL